MHLANSHLHSLHSVDKARFRVKNYSDLSQSIADYDRMKESVSTRRHTPNTKSSDNLYIAKLQSKVLEYQKKLDTQTYQIQTLTAETEHFMKICEEQKEHLNNLNIDMMRQQYEEQINELVQEKQRTTELVYNLTEQYKEIEQHLEMGINTKKQQNDRLTAMIQQALSEKQQLLKQIKEADRVHEINENTIFEQEERIDQLRNIQRKLVIALKEVQNIEKKK